MRKLSREDPIVCGLIQLIRAEGERSKYLIASTKQLYNIYEPLQAYNLDLTTSQTADYKRLGFTNNAGMTDDTLDPNNNDDNQGYVDFFPFLISRTMHLPQ